MKYWYKKYIGECPICGRDKSYKERMYSEKPIVPQDRVTYLSLIETYDNCEGY